MSKFEICMPHILQAEGGLVDHKSDPGGITNKGISFRFIKELKDGDVNGDGVIDADDIRDMTDADATKLYKKYFWNKWFEELNDIGLALHLFDMSVNAGSRRAVKILQAILQVKEDGIIGPATVKAANKHQTLSELYAYGRKEYYKAIVKKNAKLEVFLKGWFNRVDSCHL